MIVKNFRVISTLQAAALKTVRNCASTSGMDLEVISALDPLNLLSICELNQWKLNLFIFAFEFESATFGL